MKERKDIDRLFQEQFKDFEATPNEQVWSNIAAELKKDKRKTRVLPLWWQYAGIAAALILGLFIINNFDSKEIILPTPTVVNVSVSKQNSTTPPQEKVVVSEKKVIHSNSSVASAKTKVIIKQSSVKSNTKISGKGTNFNSNNKINAVVHNNITPSNIFNQKDVADKNNSPLEISEKSDSKNESLQNDIAATQSTEVVNEKIEGTNELEAILKEKLKKENTLAKVSSGKWQIIPNIAPVYLQTNSGGSAIDSQFSDNEKSAATNLSYGLGVQYAVTSKLTVRSGINKLGLDYNTNDIVYAPGLASNSIASINYDSNSAIEVQSQSTYNSLSSAEKEIQKTENGSISQKMGYYELPMEVSYTIVDKKIGISVIGGFSTLFLSDNKVSLKSTSSNVTLGEANNLSKIHLSSNFGVGFKYQLVPSLQFHFEPMIKYQFNTFSSNSNDFRPMFIGLYSGVSYRF
ncbi:MSCRAMM family adhesin SdrC [Flavobacterium algicola]|uniref:MSCRAMM family adhesin SdrC n=1 Tax=Flavobacterium algicola TaxID=556529 RepID=UPI001EFCB149|nr:MSCRAMM family adhesin SdrC [Flavobacterium algicola]MCG9791974.1 MSCRAMM family adhesin SdrC [Flavobacterium algicola]